MDSYVDVMHRLRDDLARAGYDADGVLEAIGPAGQAGLGRNHSFAARRALAGRDDGLAALIRFFILQGSGPVGDVCGVADVADLAGVVDVGALAGLGILSVLGGMARATVDIRPYEDVGGGVAGWVISDHASSLDTANWRPHADHVLGVSPASVALAQITPTTPVGRALDLGTGSGVQALHLARHAGHVTATDVNPRALKMARWTFALNDVAVETRLGSLYEPVAGERFDRIATNPPFVISPKTGQRLAYRETAHLSDGLMRAVVHGAGARLEPGGSLHVVGNWAHVSGQDWPDRLAEWVPDGCDAFVVQRELLDVYEYTEVWLADAGLSGRAEYRQRYEDWLTYFDELGIEAVGLGWITMAKTGSASPRVRSEHWPHPVAQPVAADLMAHLAAMDYAAWSDERLLGTRWQLAGGVIQEMTGLPGEPPAQTVLRRTDGLMRAAAVGPELGGVIGACDGELPLGVIIAAVADIAGTDPGTMGNETLPVFRDLLARTWLTPVP